MGRPAEPEGHVARKHNDDTAAKVRKCERLIWSTLGETDPAKYQRVNREILQLLADIKENSTQIDRLYELARRKT